MTTDNSELRRLARALFRTDDEQPDEHGADVKRRGNVVPKEGHSIPKPVDPDAELRRYARVLFGYNADD